MFKLRLSGVSPFLGSSISEILENNKVNEIDFPAEFFASVTPEALDLISKMTESDQYKRFSAKECLSHSWFTLPGLDKHLLKDVGYNLKKFNTGNIGKKDLSPDVTNEAQMLTPNLIKRALSNSKRESSVNEEEDDTLLSVKKDRFRRGSVMGIFPDSQNIQLEACPLPKSDIVQSSVAINQYNPFFSSSKTENEFPKSDDELDIPDEKEVSNETSTINIVSRSFIPEPSQFLESVPSNSITGVSKRIFQSNLCQILEKKPFRLAKSFIIDSNEKKSGPAREEAKFTYKISIKDTETSQRSDQAIKNPIQFNKPKK